MLIAMICLQYSFQPLTMRNGFLANLWSYFGLRRFLRQIGASGYELELYRTESREFLSTRSTSEMSTKYEMSALDKMDYIRVIDVISYSQCISILDMAMTSQRSLPWRVPSRVAMALDHDGARYLHA